MMKQQFQNRTMPKHYMVCFNDACTLADKCLRRLVERSGKQTDELVTAVNPARCSGENCRHYKEKKVVTMAYGMTNSFREVKAVHISTLREILIDHFGCGSYYLRRNGKRPITPEEQQYIASLFQKYGYELTFDSMEEEIQW